MRIKYVYSFLVVNVMSQPKYMIILQYFISHFNANKFIHFEIIFRFA